MIRYSIECQECGWAVAVDNRITRIEEARDHRIETGHAQFSECESVGAEEAL
jgi:hypothetical protein